MQKEFSVPGGYVKKSVVRPRRYRWKNYEMNASGYIGIIRAWLLWRRLGSPTN